MIKFLRSLFRSKPEKKTESEQKQRKSAPASDPLDLLQRRAGWEEGERPNPIQKGIEDFPMNEMNQRLQAVGDGKMFIAKVGDSDESNQISMKLQSNYQVPELLASWYMSQSFIGYQSCAIIAQHWLVDKACSMIGQDASRNGWELKSASADSDDLEIEEYHKLREFDQQFKLKENLAQLDRFKNIFGIRVAIFCVDSDDPEYYEKPFNIDGIRKGTYKGISQVDPYWMMPMMTAQSTSDPSSIHFYDPEYWVISGVKYHRSHLIIARAPEPADILKPTYIFGGVPLTQRIYERVYAAERTANEAPLLALNKRTTALHVDVEKALTQFSGFMKKLQTWIMLRDNHAVKILGKEEVMEQFDTNLSDFDSVIMNQYQLVAAIAKTPATKLLGTSPKGFNATGEFEMKSYHEELESTQEHVFCPLLDRHYEILAKSLGIDCTVKIVFNPVDSLTTKELAEINKLKSDTYQLDVNSGAVSPEEVRQRLKSDQRSGYTNLTDDDANSTPGMSPENLAEFEKAGAQEQKAQNEQMRGTAAITVANAKAEGDNEANALVRGAGDPPMAPNITAPLKLAEPGIVLPSPEQTTVAILGKLVSALELIESRLTPEGGAPEGGAHAGVQATVKPGVTGIEPSVVGIGGVVGQREQTKLPKMKVNGMLITIENPRNSIRSGMDIDGATWSTKMPHHYGFIRGVKGTDGDELDAFIGPNLQSDTVFVINQNDPRTGEFDEHKCMIGFDSEEDAVAAYKKSFSDDWKGFGDVVGLSMDQFKHWLQSVPGPTEQIRTGTR